MIEDVLKLLETDNNSIQWQSTPPGKFDPTRLVTHDGNAFCIRKKAYKTVIVPYQIIFFFQMFKLQKYCIHELLEELSNHGVNIILLSDQNCFHVSFKYTLQLIGSRNSYLTGKQSLEDDCRTKFSTIPYFLADPSNGMQLLLNSYTDNVDMPILKFIPPDYIDLHGDNSFCSMKNENTDNLLCREIQWNHYRPHQEANLWLSKIQTKKELLKSVLSLTFSLKTIHSAMDDSFFEIISTQLQRLKLHDYNEMTHPIFSKSWLQLRELELKTKNGNIPSLLSMQAGKLPRLKELKIVYDIDDSSEDECFIKSNSNGQARLPIGFLSSLKTLHIENNVSVMLDQKSRITDFILPMVGSVLLRDVYITTEGDVCNKTFSQFLEKNSKIKSLKIEELTTKKLEINTVLTDLMTLELTRVTMPLESLITILWCAPNIEKVVLDSCKFIFNENPAAIYNRILCNFEQLKELSVEPVNCVPSDFLSFILEKSKNISPRNKDNFLLKLQGVEPEHQKIPSYSLPRSMPSFSHLTMEESFEINKMTPKSQSVTSFFKSCTDNKTVKPNYYRLSIFERVINADQKITQFPFQKKPKIFYKMPEIFKDPSQSHPVNYFEGRCTLNFTEQVTSIRLPSLSTQETIRAINIHENNFQGKIINDLFAMERSDDEGLYYLTLKKKKTITIAVKFLVYSLPNDQLPAPLIDLKADIEIDIRGRKKRPDEPCRNLAAYAMDIFREYHLKDEKMRLVRNDIHAFTEVFFEERWYRICWGGVASGSTTNNSLFEDNAPSSPSMMMASQASEAMPQPALPMPIKPAFTFDAPLSLLEFDRGSNLDEQVKPIIKHFYNMKIPVFYADSINQLRCMGPSIELDNEFNAHIINQGQYGGEFYRFVQRNQALQSVIIINLANITAGELVQINKLFEAQRTLQNFVIPANFTILLLGIKNEYYQGDDFIRRIKRHNIYSFSEVSLLTLPEPVLEDPFGMREIDLYNSDDWQGLLLGGWAYHSTGLFFSCLNGNIVRAINDEKDKRINLVFKNPPCENAEFKRFYLLLTMARTLNIYGLQYDVPNNLFIETDQDNIIEARFVAQHQFISCDNIPLVPIDFVLTTSSFFTLFKNYEFIQDKIMSAEGWLNKKLNSTLSLFLTSDLHIQQWRQLFSKANELKVKLFLFYPKSLNLCINIQSSMNRAQESLCKTQVILTPHYNEQAILYKGINNSAHVIMLDDLESNHLIYNVTPTAVGNIISFSHRPGALINLLECGKTVVLVGTPNKVLADQLAELMLLSRWTHNGQSNNLLGNLVIITPSRDWINYLPQDCFVQNIANIKNKNPSFVLSLAHDDVSSTFIKARIDAIKSARSLSQVIALRGSTGIGKTSFIYSKDFEQCFDRPIQIYEELAICIRSAREDTKGDEHVLVIDEGNLSDQTMQQLMMLFLNGGTGIVLDHEYIYTTTFKNRLTVIITMNPLSYGAGRKQLPILEYAAQVEFPLMPFNYIKEKILLPLLKSRAEALDYLWKGLALLYKIGCEEKVGAQITLITARELAQIVKLVAVEGVISISIINEAFIFFAENLLSTEEQERFKSNMGITNTLAAPSMTKITDHYSITTSRVYVYSMLERFLKLTYSESEGETLSSAPKSGLSGFMLEGSSGIGKSAIVNAALSKNEFIEITLEQLLNQPLKTGQKYFVQLPVTEDSEVRQVVFNKAIEKNVLVWCDEFNTNFIDERLLNLCLDRGLKLVITQNPADNPMYRGRFKFSPALLRRFMTVQLKPYSQQELSSLRSTYPTNTHFA